MWNANTASALHFETYSRPVRYAATSLALYTSTGTTLDVLEREHDVALYDVLSSRIAAATMGSALSVFPVQINIDFFCPLHCCNKKKEIPLVYLNIRYVNAVDAVLR